MSSTSSAASGVSASASSEPECEPSPSAKSTPTAGPSCKSIGPMFPITTTCERLPDIDSCTMESDHPSLPVDFHVKAHQQAGAEQDLMIREADCGSTISDSLAIYDRVTSSWKTPQGSILSGLDEFSETWPPFGTMRNGCVFRQPPVARHSAARARSLLPTPLASDNRDRGDLSNPSIQRRKRIGKQIGFSMLFKGKPCPLCAEGTMGIPKNWSKE